MVDAVQSVTKVKTSDVAAARPVVRAPAEKFKAEEPAVVVKEKQQPISPRIREDSLAGAVVTEFVGSNGEVSQQVPSQAALAYLRAGLTAQGNPIDRSETDKVEG